MKKLTPRLARAIAMKYFKKIDDSTERKFATLHTKSVVRIALLISKILKADTKIVEISAWLHDIGKIIEMNNHSEHAITLLEKEKVEITPIIKECILNHGSDGKPVTQEARSIQMADRLQIFDFPTIKIILEKKNISDSDIGYINKMATESINYIKLLAKR